MHPYFTMNFADKEMFAYNAHRAKVQQHFEQHPENRIRYAIQFLDAHIEDGDEEMTAKCYNAIAKYSEQLDWSEVTH